MSNSKRLLSRSYQEVRKLYADLQPAVLFKRDWKGNIFARHTLGDNVEVELSYLAEHFLLAWHDWWSMCKRYLRYFGLQDESLPQSWWKLGEKTNNLAQHLAREAEPAFIISKNWARSYPDPPKRPKAQDARTLTHRIINSHRRTSTYSALRYEPDQNVDPLKEEQFKTPVLLQLPYGDRYPDLMFDWEVSSRKVREDTLRNLHNYRHATLAVSWLQEDELRTVAPSTTMLFILSMERPMQQPIADALQRLNLEEGVSANLRTVLERVVTAINEIGYTQFLSDIQETEFQVGEGTPVGSAEVNLIPGNDDDVFHSILLAVSQGEKKAIGFPNIMKRVREHLIRSSGVTKAVIVICDYWWSGMLDDHIRDLRAHHDKGVQFLFLMVGTPNRVVTPIAVDLALSS